MGNRSVVSGDEELRLRRQWEREVLPKVLGERTLFERMRSVFQEVSEGVAPGTGVVAGAKKRDLAEQCRAWFEDWYRSLGFAITVPKPNVTNREFARRTERHQVLTYEPATADVPYEAFMRAVGQGDHWTVTDEGERAKIGWEPIAKGYWHWVDAQDVSPRLGVSWKRLTANLRLLSLEEYVKFRHALKAKTGRMLDVRTWCWLRTRFGRGALSAYGHGSRVHVHRSSADGLSIPFGGAGGRAADVV